MSGRFHQRATHIAALVLTLSQAAAAQQRGGAPIGPPTTRPDARPWHVRALAGSRSLTTDSAFTNLEKLHFSADYLKRTTADERRALVVKIHDAAAAASTIQVTEDSGGVRIQFDDRNLVFTIDDKAPFGITSIGFAAGGRPATPPLTWDQIESRMREAEAEGFSGQLLVRRDGKDFLRKTYGLADKAANRATKPDDIYCIGSAPIDFTRTAALLLIERGKLSLTDAIGKFVPGVPADKAPMTIRMILNGQSGLPNFHHLDTDPDPDLTPLSRDAALKRILAMPLLFAPGTGNEHSHSAYGLLAAIVEIVSGKTYPQFVRTEILEPLGMKRTGFYGETLGLPDSAFATGYGQHAVGTPNIPTKWGTTSWLVMGSGGMFATLDDLVRYNDGMAKGALFGGKPPRSTMASNVDGSDRGFIYAHDNNGKGDQLFMISNTQANRATRTLADQLSRLIMARQ